MEKRIMEEMTWEEFDYFRKKAIAALFPLGSLEESGPHLPLGLDTIVSEEIAKRVAEKLPVLVLPAIPVGYSEWHGGFPGTLNISVATLTQMLREICGDLVDQGVNRIVFISPHLGNETPILVVANELRKKSLARMAMFNLWTIANEMAKDIDTLVEKKITHAGEIFASVMLYLRPDLVDMQKAVKEYLKPVIPKSIQEGSWKVLFQNRHVNLYCLSSELTKSGVYGDPTQATREKGERIVNLFVDYICDFLQEFKNIPV
jgi:creatinine amidohydrolase